MVIVPVSVLDSCEYPSARALRFITCTFFTLASFDLEKNRTIVSLHYCGARPQPSIFLCNFSEHQPFAASGHFQKL